MNDHQIKLNMIEFIFYLLAIERFYSLKFNLNYLKQIDICIYEHRNI